VTVRVAYRVSGLVQGVGFRPFVHRLAGRHGLGGWVANDGGGVCGEAEGPAAAVAAFVAALAAEAPAAARVDRVASEPIAPLGPAPGPAPGPFEIRASRTGGTATTAIPADRATCAACRAEVLDPHDRRFGHPFASCTACGPRLTIATGVPFDRERTTMARFALCEACAAEYRDPADRRFHAVATCCPACGPTVRLEPEPALGVDPLSAAVAVLAAGGVVAMKGLGGHHLAAAADDEAAVARIRAIKGRERRPLAVLAPDLATAHRLCHLDREEAALLADARAPIVLARRRPPLDQVAPSVAPGTDLLGVLLPYSPLHLLIAGAFGRPLVLTSANRTDEPMVIDDGEARERLGPVVDALVTHDRPIAARVDDSVARVVGGVARVVRRARGWAPEPISLARPVGAPTLAVGADLKAAACLAVGDRAWLTTHLGDLDHPDALDAHRRAIEQLIAMVGVEPEVVAHDLHPGYRSTAAAAALAGGHGPLVAVQHHHAHVASCLAEHGHHEPALGVAFDGIGHGLDATAWGGEVLAVDPRAGTVERLAHLPAVALPGGVAAVREPWRMAVAHLVAAGIDPTGLAVVARHPDWDDVAALARSGVRSPATTSMGRLFDAVAALCGAGDVNTYEGEAAIALEQLAERAPTPAPAPAPEACVGGSPEGRATYARLVARVVEALRAGADPATVAAAFHDDVADATARTVADLARATGLGTVALSGGVFQNARLLVGLTTRLEAAGLTVLSHRLVPTNDGGIALGQAVVAGVDL
jgi:hydrogenase maturation protein HypF